MVVAEIRRTLPGAPWTYEAKDRRQREVARSVRAGGLGAILLSEVEPVITLGRRADETELRLSKANLAIAGIETFATDRGGLATYHGPGQWVLFAVDTLEKMTGDSRGVRRMVDGLLQSVAEVCREYSDGIEVRSGCELGVWNSTGKLAALGVHIEDRVVMHGIALNVFATESSFVGLRPCGLDKPVAHLSDPGNFDKIGDQLLANVMNRFWVTSIH